MLELPIMTKVVPLVMAGLFYVTTAISWHPDGGAWWRHYDPQGYDYQIKIYDKPSPMGINGGRISKLTISNNGKTVVHYERGWDIRPSTQTEQNLVDNILWEIDINKGDKLSKESIKQDKARLP